MTVPTEHREVEYKLRVPSEFLLPDLQADGLIGSSAAQEPFDMAAVYHDTASLSLIRWGATLRRRTGGSDEGWHLKLPVAGASSASRDEIRLPLAAGTVGAVPAALVDIISPLIRGERLLPQATVRTLRAPQILHDRNGVPLIELVDDEVVVLDASDNVVTQFREIELELVDHLRPHAEAHLDAIVARLVQAGAHVQSLSKAASALGERAAAPSDVPLLDWPREYAPASDALRAVISTHVRHFILSDVAVRRGLPDSVHQMRVAARRLRCALKNFAPLLDEEWASGLAGELAWVARELGAIRDTEVLLERLDRHADRLGPADGALAKAVIDHRLRQRLASARSGALGALRSDRHEWLLDDLVAAAASPTSSERADAPCVDVLPPIIDHAWHALQSAMSALRIDGPDEEWHKARIKAKRARYAVEAVAPTFGKRSWRFAAALAELTEALGEHQDSSVAQGLLRELAAGDLVDCSTAFALGRLHGFEAEQAAVARRQIIIGWPAVIRRARRSGLVRHAGR